MAAAGLLVYALSGSYAMLLDGLYSAVMVGSDLIAALISTNVIRPPDRSYPYGYDGQKALYVLFRSLVLLGMLSSAAMAAIGRLIGYLNGRAPEAIHLEALAWYSISMVILCWWLAWLYHRDWQVGGTSQLLLNESRSARVDGLISGLSELALVLSPLLNTTPLKALTPISDMLVVIVICALVIKEPLQAFMKALSQAAGAAADSQTLQLTHQALKELLKDLSCWLLEVTVMKVGRMTFAVVYQNPTKPMAGGSVDLIRQQVDERCRLILNSDVRSEVILTAMSPFKA